MSEVVNVPFKVGEKYIIRTVAYHLIGELTDIVGSFLVFKDACWLAESMRWGIETLEGGQVKEVEVFPDEVYLNWSTIVDATIWRHDLIKESLPKKD
jgi:hypothetical protein